ncbi:hypothetical protein HAHE_06340 [Haloferula helveola]|uniref:Uncharacterized protein n=1 Tax=Haloferula helveola TaxID=490095 RepID=A0ABM7RI65_9BACT|nr:hypothetical protein HAHE_06340 [Haloferula helveola]
MAEMAFGVMPARLIDAASACAQRVERVFKGRRLSGSMLPSLSAGGGSDKFMGNHCRGEGNHEWTRMDTNFPSGIAS